MRHVRARPLTVSGYSSYQGYQALLHYGDRLKPDMIFVSFNYNDRRLVLDTDFADSRETFERMHMAGRMSAFADLSYIFRGARYLMEKLNPSEPAMLGYLPKADLGALRPRVDAASYRANPAGMVQWARGRSIAVVFILLGDNPDQTHMLTEGIRLLSEGAHQDAVDMLEAGLNEGADESFAMLMSLHLAKAYEAVGRSAEAKRIRMVDDPFAGLHGGQPIVLDSDYHRIMRDVAAQMDVTVMRRANSARIQACSSTIATSMREATRSLAASSPTPSRRRKHRLVLLCGESRCVGVSGARREEVHDSVADRARCPTWVMERTRSRGNLRR